MPTSGAERARRSRTQWFAIDMPGTLEGHGLRQARAAKATTVSTKVRTSIGLAM